jgi:hypothetical protein
MKIATDFDVVNKAAPSASSGTGFQENPGIQPFEKAIPETPGEKAVNSTEPDMISKGQPFKTKGSGYCS